MRDAFASAWNVYARAAVAALVLFFALGWTQGNRTGGAKLTEPVNWPLQIRIVGAIPGVGEGACFEPNVSPGEVTAEEARNANADARACIAEARRDDRDYTKQWANWLAILLLAIAGLASHEWWVHRPPRR